MTDSQKIELAKKAISHVLLRIRDDPQTRDRMGLATQSFDLLTEAAAALFGRTVKETRDAVIPGSGDLAPEAES